VLEILELLDLGELQARDKRALIRVRANLCSSDRGIVCELLLGNGLPPRSSTMVTQAYRMRDPGCRPSTPAQMQTVMGQVRFLASCESANADPEAGVDGHRPVHNSLSTVCAALTPSECPFHRPPEHRETSVANGTPSSPFGRICGRGRPCLQPSPKLSVHHHTRTARAMTEPSSRSFTEPLKRNHPRVFFVAWKPTPFATPNSTAM